MCVAIISSKCSTGALVLNSHSHNCSARNPTGPRRKLLYVAMAMYLTTFASWITLVVTQFQTFHTIRRNLSEIYSWIPPSDCFFRDSSDDALPAYCTTIPAEVSHNLAGYWPATSECVGTVSLTFNVRIYPVLSVDRAPFILAMTRISVR